MHGQAVNWAKLYELALLGLHTWGIGPEAEWDPQPDGPNQINHDAFWKAVRDIVPDDEDDEPFWMTTDAALQLELNN